ncbi:MAG: glycosyltransferase, partial [Actinomycetota bacterium]|nr:glycosyltransferase [Actinomycetota bacterium]
MYDLSIVIPVYNSEKTIFEVARQIEGTLGGKLEYELILVNDGSADASYEECRKLSESNDFIKFINLSKNFGQHNAVLAGLKFAGGKLIAVMDDDLQSPTDEIWKLINKIREGYDVVYAGYIYKKHNLLRNMGSKINGLMERILLKKPEGIKTSSYFIIRKYIVKEIIKYEGPYPYVAGLILRITANIAIVNVSHKERPYGKSNYSFIKLLKLWVNGFTNFSVKPLRIALFTGILIAFIGFVLSIVLIIRKFVEPGIAIGWTSIIVAVFIFSGIQLISVGLIGEYVGRSFLSLNKQP